MEENYKIRQDSNVWKRDITLLCCVLRLRCQPVVPYETIADVILDLLPGVPERLAGRVGAWAGFGPPKGRMKLWLAEYLQQSFEYAEHWNTELWSATQDWAMDIVGEVLRVSQLYEKGFTVADDAEVRLQIKWRKEGNWKAGSTPLGRPLAVGVLRAATADATRGHFMAQYEGHLLWREFNDQLEHWGMKDQTMITDICPLLSRMP
jgi:hypothetical protein